MNVENEQIPYMVEWFRNNFPEISPLMVYAPRAYKNRRTIEKKGGNYGGAELIILYPNNGYSSLCVQVLNSSERNSDCHKSWRSIVEHSGNKCVTIRTLSQFCDAVEEYLEGSPYA